MFYEGVLEKSNIEGKSREYDSFWDVNSNPAQRYVSRVTFWWRYSASTPIERIVLYPE